MPLDESGKSKKHNKSRDDENSNKPATTKIQKVLRLLARIPKTKFSNTALHTTITYICIDSFALALSLQSCKVVAQKGEGYVG